MRDYSKVSPRFWTGDTGRAIRKLGPEVQVVAFYLFTCPGANMLGLYYLPLPVLVHETGRPLQGALKALRSLSEASFAYYDEATEHVYLPNMAREQIGVRLSAKDNRHISILRELEQLRKTPFFNDFVTRYREAFVLHDVALNDETGHKNGSPFKGPSEPLRSQEQAQEQEQEQEEEGSPASRARAFGTARPEGNGRSSRVLPAAEPPPGLNAAAWERWLDYRRQIRKPLKPPSIPAAQREMAALGAGQADAVEHTIAKGWIGLRSPDKPIAKGGADNGLPFAN